MSIFLGAVKKSNLSQKKIKAILKAEKLIAQAQKAVNDLEERQYDEYFNQLNIAMNDASRGIMRFKNRKLDL